MKVPYLIILFFFGIVCKAQRVPLTAYTYENSTNIDNYFGEPDTLLLRYGINTVTVYSETDTLVLYRLVNYKDGKKVKVQEFNERTGKPERTIQYTYGKEKLDADLVHYPSAESFNIFPSRRFYYLERSKGANRFSRPYKLDDTITHIVRMHIRHTWRDNGSILFEGFDKDGKLIDTHVMTPLITWEEYQKRKVVVFPRTVVNELEEYQYNEKGQLVLYKNKEIPRERRYSYDERGLLQKMEVFENGKQILSHLHKYQ
jgi:antitoxin component YwqK of YwqJK toxin-antitoxin module